MSQPSDTPETEAFYAWNMRTSSIGVEEPSDFARRMEKERDAAREDARRLAALLDEPMRISGMDWPPPGWSGAAQSALAAHEALTAKN